MPDAETTTGNSVEAVVMLLVKSLADQAIARAQIACAIRQLQQGRRSEAD
jgi:hypothetical protein